MRVVALLVVLLAMGDATAKQPRSASAVNEFKRHNPCPFTAQRHGKCPGYVIDHIEPLCAGGADSIVNMQWQTRADSLIKDRQERALCRQLRATH